MVTGAASGIGAALAAWLAGRGSHLVLLDRDAEGLDGVAGAIGATCPASGSRPTSSTSPTPRDRPDRRDPRGRAPATDLLVNNAGVALGGTFDQVSAAQFDGCWRSTCTP